MPKPTAPSQSYPFPTQYTPDDYARAFQRQKDRRTRLGCFVLMALFLLCIGIGLVSDAARNWTVYPTAPAKTFAVTLSSP